ncbi:MAG: NrsF family protein [Xanthobacteraceae bacterium]
MICSDSNDRFVQVLSADLAPVCRLAPPSRRLMTWLAIVGLAALALAMVSDDRSMIDRLMAAPDMWLAAAGTLLTAVSAAAAAFQLSLPARKPAWALLPIPPALLWIGASGIGCLRPWFIAGTSPMSIGDSDNCLVFILGFSLPLSLLLIVMLRQGFSLRPNLTAVVGGLACASAAATLLNFVHPYDAAVHAAAVGIVVLANALFGGRILTSEISSTAIN